MINDKLLTIDRKNKSLIGESSTIGPFEQFNGPYNRGLAIEHNITKAITNWFVDSESRDPSGELMFWTLFPTPQTLREYPSMNGWSVVIFND